MEGGQWGTLSPGVCLYGSLYKQHILVRLAGRRLTALTPPSLPGPRPDEAESRNRRGRHRASERAFWHTGPSFMQQVLSRQGLGAPEFKDEASFLFLRGFDFDQEAAL